MEVKPFKHVLLCFCVATFVLFLSCTRGSDRPQSINGQQTGQIGNDIAELPKDAEELALRISKIHANQSYNCLGQPYSAIEGFTPIWAKKMPLSPADDANDIGEKWGVSVRFIYKCKPDDNWRDGVASADCKKSKSEGKWTELTSMAHVSHE